MLSSNCSQQKSLEPSKTSAEHDFEVNNKSQAKLESDYIRRGMTLLKEAVLYSHDGLQCNPISSAQSMQVR